MSIRDAESGSSTYKGGSGSAGGIGNGGLGGGAGNGGANSRTGLTTGTSFSGKQTGMPGGISDQLAAAYAQARGVRPGVSAPVRRVATTVAPPPPVRYGTAPAKYPVGTLAKSMWDNIFNGPAAPPSGVTEDMVPGFGVTYTPPANVSLPAPPGVKQIYDRAPQDPNFPGNNFNQNTRHVEQGKLYTDRVPQVGGGGQSAVVDKFGKK